MITTTWARRAAATAAALLLAGAMTACGGGGNDSSSPATTKATTSSVTVAPVTVAPSTTVPAAPCGGAAAVEAAVRSTSVAGLGSASSQFDVSGVQVATSDPTWARFSDQPKPGVVDFQGGYGIAHCENGTWVVTDAGSAEVGCPGGANPGPPAAIRAELSLMCP